MWQWVARTPTGQAATFAANSTAAANATTKTSPKHGGPVNPATAFVTPIAVDKGSQITAILEVENQKPIEYYGKVVDQYGSPIADAEVQGGVLLNVNFDASRTDIYTTKTNAEGLFEFDGLHGVSIGISIKKANYVSSPSGFRKPAGGNQSTPTDRATFVMWKLQGGEPLVHQNFIVKLQCDGTQEKVNLLKGTTVSSNADMVIRFTRNPVQIVRGTPFEWTLTLEVPGGGLIEVHEPYLYEAPESGYQETVTITTGPNPQSYADSARQAYYYKSADGKYGRISIDLQADFQPPPTYFGINIYLNPSGSRNLEFDPKKEIKTPAP